MEKIGQVSGSYLKEVESKLLLFFFFPVDGKTVFTTFDTTIQRHIIVCDYCGMMITLTKLGHPGSHYSTTEEVLFVATLLTRNINRQKEVSNYYLGYMEFNTLLKLAAERGKIIRHDS